MDDVWNKNALNPIQLSGATPGSEEERLTFLSMFVNSIRYSSQGQIDNEEEYAEGVVP